MGRCSTGACGLLEVSVKCEYKKPAAMIVPLFADGLYRRPRRGGCIGRDLRRCFKRSSGFTWRQEPVALSASIDDETNIACFGLRATGFFDRARADDLFLKHLLRPLWFVLWAGILLWHPSDALSASSKEFQVKMGFILNFLKFVEWPESAADEENQPLLVGVVGSVPMQEGTTEIPNQVVNGRRIAVTVLHQWQRDASDVQTKLVEHCEALYYAGTEETTIESLLASVTERPVLTIGESGSFLKKGGIFNFVIEGGKVRFEVSQKNAKKSALTIRSQLLRLARKVE